MTYCYTFEATLAPAEITVRADGEAEARRLLERVGRGAEAAWRLVRVEPATGRAPLPRPGLVNWRDRTERRA